MSLIKSLIAAPNSILQNSFSRKVYLNFARKYDLVYFGYVDQTSDEHQLVRGITLSPGHVDNNYSIGNVAGSDVTLVQRRDLVSFPGKPDKSYSWNILRVDLKGNGFPRFFIDANHHDETFYANLFVKFASFKSLNNYFSAQEYNPQFNKSFKVYGDYENADYLTNLLSPKFADDMIHHFRHFDFEILPESVLVYSTEAHISLKRLEDMLRAGLWLSERCNESIEN